MNEITEAGVPLLLVTYANAAPQFGDLFQFLTRFLGVPVAPGFFFMAGFMVALTSSARENRGVSHFEVTRRLLIRGLVLIAVDAIIMGLPRALMGFYSFMVLTSFACVFLALAMLARTARDHVPGLLFPFAIFGRVPFFFYVVHFYVLGIAQAALGIQVGPPETYAIWLLLLLAMAWPCAWYYDKKRRRPNLLTRYF